MTTFLLKGDTKLDGIPTSGIQCVAFLESRFSSVPILNSPFPDLNAPDAGPVASGETFGGVGAYQLTVSDAANYYVACYQATSPNLIAWEGPLMATPHTSRSGWTQFASPTRGAVVTTCNGGVLTLPQATITVLSTSGFASSGTLLLLAGSWQVVTYTGTSGGTSFTGCSGGTGAIGNTTPVLQAYINGPYRRLVFATFDCEVFGSGDSAAAEAFASVAGTISSTAVAAVGLSAWTASTSCRLQSVLQFPVDPNGAYAIQPEAVGAGTVIKAVWWEVDF